MAETWTKTQHGKTIKKVTVKWIYEDIRDTHVQNVNRNALKVAIECKRACACAHTNNKGVYSTKKRRNAREKKAW